MTFPIIQSLVESVITVTEEEIWEALRWVFLRLKLVIELSSAVPLAALMSGKLPEDAYRVGVIVSGGNINPPVLARIMGKQPAPDEEVHSYYY
ncbi:threonine dehydratase [Desmospora profundinema]|uniref:Threonine dehydratase n=2 Tax=Desmospora profundinema TaxID=1571184 RepID=A0ABU1IRS6_9BACL|nr:threonine dehydratase [Desmospora profundinema]